MKKLFITALFSLFSLFPLFADLELRVDGNFNIPTDSNYKKTPGISAGIEFSPFTVRERDSVYFAALGSYSNIEADGIDPISLFDVQLALGYNWRINDRFSAAAEMFGGVWSSAEDENYDINAASGLLLGGRAAGYFHIFPELSAGLHAGYKVYRYKPEPVSKRVELGLTLKYNFSKGIFGSSSVVAQNTEEIQAGPLFPVFYSRYGSHKFGEITFINNEKNDISDVEVFVFIEQYMSNPDSSAVIESVKRGESFTAPLTAFINESILNNLVAQKCDARIIVKYRSLGRLKTSEQVLELVALNRNAMTWQDDRAAAAFVSGRDAAAASFAKRVKSMTQSEFVSSRPENIQIGAALFGALKVYGMNYVVDPSSAFIDNIGTSSVDFLKFPYQTILYRGGDCDDLTIVNCALFESLGIETAMITVPGHILMAFDSGVSPSETSKISDGYFIVQDGKVWIPLEVTLTQGTFALQRQTAYREWTKFKKERALIPMKEAWKEFKAVGIPDSDVKLDMPSKNAILREFRNNNY